MLCVRLGRWLMAVLPTLLVDGNALFGPRQWISQQSTSIDEGIASADGLTVRSSSIGGSENRNSTLDTSFTLQNTPADFDAIIDLSWQVRYSADSDVGDDTLTFGIRIVNGAQILAAADSGGAFQTIRTGENTTWSLLLTNSPVTAFSYVNTSAIKSTWDGAEVELRSTHAQNMGPDDNGVVVDTLQFTGNYTQTVAGTGSAYLRRTPISALLQM